jgi:hypothetical protein
MAQFILPSNDVLKDKVVVLTSRLALENFYVDSLASILPFQYIVSLFGACIDNYNFKGN